MINFSNLPREVIDFVRYSSIAGFIVTSTLVINLDYKLFGRIFGENSKKYWWLFVISGIIPLLVFLYLFTVLFGKLIPA